MCTVAGTKGKLFIDGSLSALNQTRINRRNERKNGKIMKSCGYYAMGQHLSASIQKHKSRTNQRKTGKIVKSCGYYAMGKH